MSQYKEIFDKNLARVEGLCALYMSLKENNQSDAKDYKLTDILRAAVVFLHSSFEEYFRNVLIEWLPIRATDETLKAIPISINAGKKPEKLLLSDLAHYRDRTIDEIIHESVLESMKLKSFNNECDIKSWCKKIVIEEDGFPDIKSIDKAINRRHKIVHEADTNREAETNKERLQPIKPGDINSWISSYRDLVVYIDQQVDDWEKNKWRD